MKVFNFFISIVILAFCGCEKIDPDIDGNLVAKTVINDLAIPSIQLSSTKLHVQSFGNSDSTKVFILEGGPGDDFRYLLDLNQSVDGWSLLEHFQVIYHDYRGCGLSQRHPMEELKMRHSLMDLEELIDLYSPNERIILIGHSHGGTVAGQYLNKHPDRVKGAIFIEPGAFSSEINEQQPEVNSVNLFGEDVNTLLWVKQLIGMDNHSKADYLYDVARLNLEQENRGEKCPSLNYRGGAASAISIAIDEVYNTEYDYTTNFSSFNRKVLFISSDESEDLGFSFQQEYQVILFPNYKHEVIEGTGHSGLINCKTTETLSMIKTYLDELQ